MWYRRRPKNGITSSGSNNAIAGNARASVRSLWLAASCMRGVRPAGLEREALARCALLLVGVGVGTAGV